MSEYVIFTDMDADLTQAMVDQMDIEVLPMRFAVDGKEYLNYPDGREMQVKDFYTRLRTGVATSTSQINTPEYEDAFRPFLEAGKDVLYLGFSSGLSGTVNAAMLAAENLNAAFPGRKVMVVDTLCASLGQTLLVRSADALKKLGKSMEEVAAWANANKLKICHLVVVDDLNFLKRGGRLSASSALMGTMLNIKPLLKIDDAGKLGAVDKVRGRKNALLRLADEVEKNAVNPGSHEIYIAHADCPDDAQALAAEIKKRIQPKAVNIEFIGPVVGGHAGPSTMALFFFGESR